jgi:hypothetical protein
MAICAASASTKGRYRTLRTRDNNAQPTRCSGDKANAFGKIIHPRSGKQAANYDPKTQKFENIDTCFTVDHNEFSHDNFIYYGTTGSVGWVNMDTWDKTHDAEKSTGWCPAVIDTNGDGKISTGWTEPDQPVDPARDHRVTFGCYAITVNEKDNSIWCSGIGSEQKRLTRITKGDNPPETCRAEIYEPPPGQQIPLVGTGGVYADSNGVVYDAWRVGPPHVIRSQWCKSTKDVKADGQSCPEGWTIIATPTNRPTPTATRPASRPPLWISGNAWLRQGCAGLPRPTLIRSNCSSRTSSSSRARSVSMSYFARSGSGRVDNPNTGWKATSGPVTRLTVLAHRRRQGDTARCSNSRCVSPLANSRPTAAAAKPPYPVKRACNRPP